MIYKGIIISRILKDLTIDREAPILDALRRISSNRSRIVFTVHENGALHGVLTDGDFRKWLIGEARPDLSLPVGEIANRNCRYYCRIDDPPLRIEEMLDPPVINMIPLLDGEDRLVGIAKVRTKSDGMIIGNRRIGQGQSTFVIAEIGNNHNGDRKLAIELVDRARAAGADCAKFQLRNLDALYRRSTAEDLGAEYTKDLLERFQLSTGDLSQVIDHVRKLDMIPLCTPWDEDSLQFLVDLGIEGLKIASADLTNHPLLESAARTELPLIVSTGMAAESEIRSAVDLLNSKMAPFCLLHCNSTYPAPFKDINLKYLDRLQNIGTCPVGYSGHERGVSVAIAAVANGASVIEKHITLDRNMEGNDHKVSLLPDEFKAMVDGIREVELAMGTDSARAVTQGELINRENLAKSLVASRDLHPGDVITPEHVEVRSPGRGLQPNLLNDLIDRSVTREIQAGDFFYLSDIRSDAIEPREFVFPFRWGIPVRHHDFAAILEKSDPDLLEFHFSYRDLELKTVDFFNGPYRQDLVVHCPELFEEDHILDLAAESAEYRKVSLDNVRRAIERTLEIRSHFQTQRPTPIVTNMGGATLDGALGSQEVGQRYRLLQESLESLEIPPEVELIAQTMPPFPWHFGGQRFHNLFVGADETLSFCESTGLRLCLDVSHTALACHHQGDSLHRFLERLGPHTIHVHLADASGVDAEGLQLGEGQIDLASLADDMKAFLSPDTTFIPEIWQGHKNFGEGFWYALDRFERAFGSHR